MKLPRRDRFDGVVFCAPAAQTGFALEAGREMADLDLGVITDEPATPVS